MNEFIVGDFRTVLPTLPERSYALILTSPPYNVGLDYGSEITDYVDRMHWRDYWRLLDDFMKAAKRLLVEGGRVAVNLPGYAVGKRPGYAHHHYMGEIARELGYTLLTEIIWDQGVSGHRTAWGSFASPSAPRFPSTHEFIEVFCVEPKRKDRKGRGDITNAEFSEWSSPIWHISGRQRGERPGSFPEAIPDRLIRLFTWQGDGVLDPFAGCGTTGTVARRLKRRYTLIDVVPRCKEMFEALLEGEPLCSQVASPRLMARPSPTT